MEKPVLFFHTDRVIEDVRVRVRFRRGVPWLAWPHARFGSHRVSWRGRLVPAAQAANLGTVTERGRRHPWWGNLRGVNAARFEPRGDHEGEDFLFYDGSLAFRSGFLFTRADGQLSVRRRGAEPSVWVSDSRGLTRYTAPDNGALAQSGATVPADQAPSVLRAELLSRGLTDAEADSLIETWRDDLLPSRGAVVEVVEEDGRPTPPRAFYFVSRTDYDRMLPISIRPVPDELVRVGLVIEVIR